MSEVIKIDGFEVTGKIGQGSFGTVYKGYDPYLKRDLAIKVCTVNDEDVHKRFFREAEIAGRLQHRSIVTVYSFGSAGDLPYLAQEFLDGEDLDQVIRRREPVDPLVKIDYLRQIADGLAYAHREGVIHRDIKPGNIRVLPGDRVKIMDFGIAKLASADTQLTQQGVTLGTASYLPPEQVRAEPLDPRADQFSFGVLAYELMSFERPFGGNTLSALVYQILYKVPATLDTAWVGCPPVLSSLVARCLDKKADRRYPNFESLLPVLDEVRSAIVAGPPPPPPKPARPPSEPPADLTITAEQHATVLLATEKQRSPVETQPLKAIADLAAAESRSSEVKPPTGGDQGPLTKTMPINVVSLDLTQNGSPEASEPVEGPDVAATVRLTVQDPLGERAREISSLIAKGELETAIQELQDTYQEHQEKTAQQTIAVPPPPETADEATPPIAGLDAREKASSEPSKSSDWPLDPVETKPVTAETIAAASEPSAADPAVSRGKRGLPRWMAAVVALLAVLALWSIFRSKGPTHPAVVTTPAESGVQTSVLPAAPVASGIVRIQATPWAQLVEVIGEDGYLQPLPKPSHSPVRLPLPVGRYQLTLLHPMAAEPVSCAVEVREDVEATCEGRFDTLTTTELFKATGWWQ